MSTQTLELDSLSTQIDETVTPNFNNLTLDDSIGQPTDGWGWNQDESTAKSEVNQDYNETTIENWSWGEEMPKVEEDNAFSFPVRNGVPDCMFYLKTGSCKFGWNCKFNHPVDVTGHKVKHRREQENFQPGELNVNGASSVMFGQANAEKTYNENKWGDYSESNGQVNCKYYSTIGGCKYGSACKFFHKDKNDDPAVLNFVGLPMRPGEKECSYYMNTGSCKYSTNCRYHHPEPTAVGARSPSGVQNGRNSQQYSSPVPQNGGTHQPYDWQTNQKDRPQQSYASPVHHNGGSQQPYALPSHQNGRSQQPYALPSHLNGGSPAQMPMAPWSLHRNPNEAVPYPNPSPSYGTTGHFIPQHGVQSKAEWNGYQAPANPMHSTELNKPHPQTSHNVNGFAPTIEPDGEYPERPGQPECQFFIRTGDCKFKAACRYHHPKHRQQASEVMPNPLGLPLRPDQPICVHFSRHGNCKFGGNCRYHHPADHIQQVDSKAENYPFSYSDDVRNATSNVQVQESGW